MFRRREFASAVKEPVCRNGATCIVQATIEIAELVHPLGIRCHCRTAWVDFTENGSAALSEHDVLDDRCRSDGNLLRYRNGNDHVDWNRILYGLRHGAIQFRRVFTAPRPLDRP